MFIRNKKIKGLNYLYLVENRWTEKGSRQKVIAYLGKGQRLSAITKKRIINIFIMANKRCMKCFSDKILTLSESYGVLCRKCIIDSA